MSGFQIIHSADVVPMVFPTGRETRVLGGVSGLPVQNFSFGYVRVETGGSVPKHSHSQEEVYMVLKGEATLQVDGENIMLSAGSAIYLPPGVEHELSNKTEDLVEFLFIYSPASFVSHWTEELQGHTGKNLDSDWKPEK